MKGKGTRVIASLHPYLDTLSFTTMQPQLQELPTFSHLPLSPKSSCLDLYIWVRGRCSGPAEAEGLHGCSCPLQAAGGMIPLPGLELDCGDHYSCQPRSSCVCVWGGGLCDNVLDPGTPTQGLSPAALILCPASVPRSPGQGAQREGWHEPQRLASLCHLLCPDELPFPSLFTCMGLGRRVTAVTQLRQPIFTERCQPGESRQTAGTREAMAPGGRARGVWIRLRLPWLWS